MSHIKEVTLTNFRVFKEKTHFQLAPITVLTGTNSSGKSSLGKMMSLLQDNIFGNDKWEGLDFSLNNHKLGSFKQCINKDSEGDSFKVSFVIDTRLEYFNDWNHEHANPFRLADEVECELEFKSEGIENARLFSFILRSENIDWLLVNWKEEEVFVSLDLKWVYARMKEKLALLSTDELPPKDSDSGKTKFRTISIEEARLLLEFNAFQRQHFGYAMNGLIHQLYECKDTFIKDVYLDYYIAPLLREAKEKPEDFIEFLEGMFLAASDAERFNYNYGNTVPEVDIRIKILQNVLHEFFEIRLDTGRSRDGFGLKFNVLERQINDFVMEDGDPMLVSIGDGAIGAEPYSEMVKPEFLAFFEYLSKATKGILNRVEATKIESIEAIRANSQRLYTNQSQGTGFNELLIRLRNEPLSEKELEFVNKWIREFKLGDELLIEGVEGVATKVSLVKNGQRRALADLGYGITQLLPLILSIALKSDLLDETEVNPHRVIFFIEEPESNLHPALQSKLADFFYDAYKVFNAQFVLESHSEYLVRKLQYLVARGEMKSEDTIIHYLYDPDAIPEGEPQMKKIRIELDGSLSESFGRGFFDEADMLAMDLFTMNNKG
jgi:predicted ATPase